jgi:hypothetical protein
MAQKSSSPNASTSPSADQNDDATEKAIQKAIDGIHFFSQPQQHDT